MNFILIGPQGSGKGTQAAFLSEKLNIPRISIGQLYRDEIRKKSVLGKKAEKFVLSGKLVPISITENLLSKELSKSKYRKGIILDGFPRNLEQNNFLSKITEIDYVILITLTEKETIKRLSNRRVCECGETYNLISKKPKKDVLCDKCGKKLYQRKDDQPAAIKQRLKVYHQDTEPIIEFYKKQGKVLKVNGQTSIKKVFKGIVKSLKEKGIK